MKMYDEDKRNFPFVVGPLDYDIMLSAFALQYRGHNAAKILFHLYFERGKRKLHSGSYIQFNNYYLKDLGITRHIKHELLRRLETYRLVKVKWQKGKSPYVRILDRNVACKKGDTINLSD
jgi:hypothetical protein